MLLCYRIVYAKPGFLPDFWKLYFSKHGGYSRAAVMLEFSFTLKEVFTSDYLSFDRKVPKVVFQQSDMSSFLTETIEHVPLGFIKKVVSHYSKVQYTKKQTEVENKTKMLKGPECLY